MKFLLIGFCSFMLVACVKWGKGSKHVSFEGYQLVGDGNDNDSTFFEVHYKNKGNDSLINTYCRMVVKDTTSKLFKGTLFSDSNKGIGVSPRSDFYYYFYAADYNPSSDVGKVKFYLSWTNPKDRRSGVRKIIYE